MTKDDFGLPLETIQYLMSAPSKREDAWESFLQQLNVKAIVHGSRGAALRHLLSEDNTYQDHLGHFDYEMYCFMNGLDFSFAERLEEITRET